MKIDERKNSLRVGSVASVQGTVGPVTKEPVPLGPSPRCTLVRQ